MPAGRAGGRDARMDAKNRRYDAKRRHRRRKRDGNPPPLRPDGWNWTAAGSPMPLIGRIDVAGAQHRAEWRYRGAAVEKSDGTKVTITFTNADPAMELKSVWHAHAGPGPVRHAMFITNRSGKPVTIYEQESLDVHRCGPGKPDATVWYIKNDASVPDKTGVYHESLVRGYRKTLADRRRRRLLHSLCGRRCRRRPRHVLRLGVEHRPHRDRLRRRDRRRRDQGRQRRRVSRPILPPARLSRSRRGSSAHTGAIWTTPQTACTSTCSTTPCPPF